VAAMGRRQPLSTLGRTIVILGLVLVVAGVLMMLLGRIGLTSLPGDLSFRRGRFTVYIPLGLSILLSIVLTLLLNLFFRR
jgi:DUF2905 family protein